MARTRERVFSILGAILFLGGTATTTVFAIVSSHNDSGSTPSTSQSTDAANTQNGSCDINTPMPAQAETAPDPYKLTSAVTTLKITDLTVGTGATLAVGQCPVVKYQGNLADGTVFDENYSKTQDLQFTLGAGQVITGWDQGLAGMKIGGVRRIEIPYDMGYGTAGSGSTIPPKADLVFIVTLENIKAGDTTGTSMGGGQ